MAEKSARILVVEDEEVSLELLTIRLENAGFEVLAAADGEEGLRLAQEESPDLILLDFMLPKISGVTVCTELKSDERFKRIPIIMLTAMAEERDLESGMQAGADDYVTKPFNWKELNNKIELLLKNRK